MLRSRRHDDVGAELGRRGEMFVPTGRGVGTIFDHGHLIAGVHTMAHDRLTGHREPDHQDAHQSSAPGMLMKSA